MKGHFLSTKVYFLRFKGHLGFGFWVSGFIQKNRGAVFALGMWRAAKPVRAKRARERSVPRNKPDGEETTHTIRFVYCRENACVVSSRNAQKK